MFERRTNCWNSRLEASDSIVATLEYASATGSIHSKFGIWGVEQRLFTTSTLFLFARYFPLNLFLFPHPSSVISTSSPLFNDSFLPSKSENLDRNLEFRIPEFLFKHQTGKKDFVSESSARTRSRTYRVRGSR